MGYKSKQGLVTTKPSPPAKRFLPHEFAERVSLAGGLPRLLVSRESYEDMFNIVDIVSDEVGWVGAVERVGRDFLLKEIFLPKQEAHATTCELTPEGLSELATELMSSREDGVEVANSLRFWGHSHHTMGTSPSEQDEDQLRELAGECGDYFIRAILNKAGRMEITIYLADIGVVVRDVEWELHEPIEVHRRERWKTEVEEKVSKKSFFSIGSLGKGYTPSKLSDVVEDLGELDSILNHEGGDQ